MISTCIQCKKTFFVSYESEDRFCTVGCWSDFFNDCGPQCREIAVHTDLGNSRPAKSVKVKTMEKPTKKQHEYFDYHECAKYIAFKLDIEDIRDVLGKFTGQGVKDVEYQDFWHAFMDADGGVVHNGMFMHMHPESFDLFPVWAQPIAKAFVEEFGENADYWVEW